MESNIIFSVYIFVFGWIWIPHLAFEVNVDMHAEKKKGHILIEQ